MGYVAAFVLGIVVGTVGFTGVATMVDSAVQTIQKSAEELAR